MLSSNVTSHLSSLLMFEGFLGSGWSEAPHSGQNLVPSSTGFPQLGQYFIFVIIFSKIVFKCLIIKFSEKIFQGWPSRKRLQGYPRPLDEYPQIALAGRGHALL